MAPGRINAMKAAFLLKKNDFRVTVKVEQHKERTLLYAAVTNEDANPLLVTLIEEEIRVYEGVPIVPVQKLNGFVKELDAYVQGDFFCDCEDEIPYEDDLPLPDEIPLQPSALYGPGE